MSEAELQEDEALAAEHALGVLGAHERAAAEHRMAHDPGFAAFVGRADGLARVFDDGQAMPVGYGVDRVHVGALTE